MLFKGWPWEAAAKIPTLLPPQAVGIYFFYAYDPFIEQIFLQHFRHSRNQQGDPTATSPIPVQVALGSELTRDKLENHLTGLTLFGPPSPLIVLQAQGLMPDIQQFLLERPPWSEGQVILSFQKSCSLFEKMAKKRPPYTIKILAPRFWESEKLLNFLAQEMRLPRPLSLPIKKYLLKALPATCADFWRALNLIKLSFPNGEASLPQLQALLLPEKLERFELASLWGQKKKALFFQQLLAGRPEAGDLQPFFSFMQGHIKRLGHPYEHQHKASPSRYDREIVSQSQGWTRKESLEALRLFGDLEIWAKTKHPLLSDRLRALALWTPNTKVRPPVNGQRIGQREQASRH